MPVARMQQFIAHYKPQIADFKNYQDAQYQ